MLRTALIFGAVGALTLPATASAQMVPQPVPETAKRVTLDLASDATWAKAQAERFDESRWPDGARITVRDCKVVDRRHGHCFYDIDHWAPDNSRKACERRVNVTIRKKTKRVRVRVRGLGCHETPA